MIKGQEPSKVFSSPKGDSHKNDFPSRAERPNRRAESRTGKREIQKSTGKKQIQVKTRTLSTHLTVDVWISHCDEVVALDSETHRQFMQAVNTGTI